MRVGTETYSTAVYAAEVGEEGVRNDDVAGAGKASWPCVLSPHPITCIFNTYRSRLPSLLPISTCIYVQELSVRVIAPPYHIHIYVYICIYVYIHVKTNKPVNYIYVYACIKFSVRVVAPPYHLHIQHIQVKTTQSITYIHVYIRIREVSVCYDPTLSYTYV